MQSVEKLRHGRIYDVIGQIERGEAVDPTRLLLLQMLDTVQSGREFLADAIESHEAADERAITAATER